MSEQPPLFTCKAHVFQVDPDTRKSWIPLSNSAVNVQIFHDSIKNVYRIVSVDGSKVLINTIITARMSFTKTSHKFCQWVDSKANQVFGLGFSHERDLIRFMDKFIEVKEATRNTLRSSSVDTRQTSRSESDWSTQSNRLDQASQLKQENANLKFALAQNSNTTRKWQEELEILRNINVKLTTALQESHANVEEWKRQLQFYRDECSRLRQMVSNHYSPVSAQGSEAHEFKNLLDSADRRNKEQEQKILQLDNQIQRYISQIGSLKDQLTEREINNQNLISQLQRRTPQDYYSSRTVNRSTHRNFQQLIHLCDLFQAKSSDFSQIMINKSQDLQRLCSQITQTLVDI